MAVSNMPDPDSTSSKGYKWLYGTAHGIIGGLGNVIFASKANVQLPAPMVTTQAGTTTIGPITTGKVNSYTELGK